MIKSIRTKGAEALLELTKKCNYACPYCYCVWHEAPYPQTPELELDTWLYVIKKLAALRVKRVTLTGGEPLLKDGFWEILTSCANTFGNENCCVFSNAKLLTKKELKAFKNLGIRFSTSLQGLSTYAKMTGTNLDFVHTLEIIEEACDMGLTPYCSCTLTSQNLHEYIDIVIAAHHVGANIMCVPFMKGGRGIKNSNLAVSEECWQEVKSRIKELKLNVVFGEEMQCYCNTNPEHDCPAGDSFFVIDPMGNIRKCLHTTAILGNILD